MIPATLVLAIIPEICSDIIRLDTIPSPADWGPGTVSKEIYLKRSKSLPGTISKVSSTGIITKKT